MITMSSATIIAPAVCWSASARDPAALDRVVDARVDRLADEHEGHAEEHAEHARGDDVADLPQLAAQPPALGLERRPPDEDARRR